MALWTTDPYTGLGVYGGAGGTSSSSSGTTEEDDFSSLVDDITTTLGGLTSTTGTEGVSDYQSWEDYLGTIDEDLYNQIKTGLTEGTTGGTYTAPTIDYTSGVDLIDTSTLPYLESGQGLYDAYRSQGLNDVYSAYGKSKEEAADTYFGNQYAYQNAMKNLSSDEALAASGSTSTAYANAETANQAAESANLQAMLDASLGNLGAQTQMDTNQLAADTATAEMQYKYDTLGQGTANDSYSMLLDLLKSV